VYCQEHVPGTGIRARPGQFFLVVPLSEINDPDIVFRMSITRSAGLCRTVACFPVFQCFRNASRTYFPCSYGRHRDRYAALFDETRSMSLTPYCCWRKERWEQRYEPPTRRPCGPHPRNARWRRRFDALDARPGRGHRPSSRRSAVRACVMPGPSRPPRGGCIPKRSVLQRTLLPARRAARWIHSRTAGQLCTHVARCLS